VYECLTKTIPSCFILDAFGISLASLSRRPLSTESGPALPLILTALGLVSAAIACAFGKCHKEEHKTNQEEEDPGARDEAGLFHGEWGLTITPETHTPGSALRRCLCVTQHSRDRMNG
jgi:hypothetical protein